MIDDKNLKKLGLSQGIDKDYLDAIIYAKNNIKIKLILIGIDPFPNDAIGIPFCKSEWSDLGLHTGYRVFSSILNKYNLLNISETPKKVAIRLAKEEGVIFLNSSYELLRNIQKNNRERAKFQGYNFNKFFIELNQKFEVICMGRGYTFTQKYMTAENKDKLKRIFHASAYPAHRNNPLWKCYWNKGCLRKRFGIELKAR